jgi:twitching motility protein PilT
MHCTPAIRAMIRDNKTFQIPSTIQTSRKLGMITLDDALIEAVNRGDISKDSAIEFATDRTAMEAKFSPSIKPKEGGVFRW